MNAGRKDLDAWLDEFAPALADGDRIPGAPVDPNMSIPAGPPPSGQQGTDARTASFFDSVRREGAESGVPSLELTPADLGDDVAPSLGRWPDQAQSDALPGWDNAEPLGWMQATEPNHSTQPQPQSFTPPAQPGWDSQPPAQPGWDPQPPAQPGWDSQPPAQPGWDSQPPAQPGWDSQPPAQPGWDSQPPAQPGWESLSAPIPGAGTQPGHFGQAPADPTSFAADPFAAPARQHETNGAHDPYGGDPYKALAAQQSQAPVQDRPQDVFPAQHGGEAAWPAGGTGMPPHQTDAEFSATLGGGGGFFEAAKDNPAARFLLEWLPILVGAAIVATLVRAFVFQAYFIPSESMLPTLAKKNRVLVNKLSYDFHEVNRGDVIVFGRPENEPEGEIPDLIKRVIGLPGETIQLRNGEVYVDGALVRESYLVDQVSTRPLRNTAIPGCINGTPTDCTIPEGYVFVMGDNRIGSRDGREFGPIPVDSIVGRAFVRVWPVDSIGLL